VWEQRDMAQRTVPFEDVEERRVAVTWIH